jgi:hypothetical protein
MYLPDPFHSLREVSLHAWNRNSAVRVKRRQFFPPLVFAFRSNVNDLQPGIQKSIRIANLLLLLMDHHQGFFRKGTT